MTMPESSLSPEQKCCELHWKTKRKILGMSAILLPVTDTLEVDWTGFRQHVQRTVSAGLIPAVNMDTGFGHLIDMATRKQVLRETQAICGQSQYVAGAFVGDQPGAPLDLDTYVRQIELIQEHSGTPVIFQSFGLTQLDEPEILEAYRGMAARCDQFIGFELGTMFAPFGRIYSLETYRGLMEIPQCMGAKHSSLDRNLEWERLKLRDQVRPDFRVLTGNDLAVDMVMYGSDYLLGLSTMAPDLFAKRDAYWENGSSEFFHLNDWLQYLGFFTFRPSVPAYKHSAAQFLKLRGWIESDQTYPGSPQRPVSDVAVLETLLESLQKWI